MVNAGKIVPAQGITVHTDKHGVTREYREVKRKANVGELVKITKPWMGEDHTGHVYTVTYAFSDGLVDTDGKYSDGSALNPDCNEYVVLEPTDIVHYDGKRWREVKKPGSPYSYETVRNGLRIYLEPIDEQPDRLTALEHRVAALEQHLEVLSDKQWLREVERAYSESDSPQQYTREQVIELAKKDVEELFEDDLDDGRSVTHEDCGHCRVRFVVDRKKRTVVALLRMTYMSDDGDVDYKGIAHCAPDDCFNVHIGKAIALRRALGLDVPAYYVNAPKPTEVQKGDVVTFPSVKDTAMYHVRTLKPTSGNLRIVKSSFDCMVGTSAYVDSYDNAIILDDSHDFGGEGQ